ncbi:MAG: hypothetical protein WBW34_00180 [Nitrososphaeraceae archaeon]
MVQDILIAVITAINTTKAPITIPEVISVSIILGEALRTING